MQGLITEERDGKRGGRGEIDTFVRLANLQDIKTQLRRGRGKRTERREQRGREERGREERGREVNTFV